VYSGSTNPTSDGGLFCGSRATVLVTVVVLVAGLVGGAVLTAQRGLLLAIEQAADESGVFSFHAITLFSGYVAPSPKREKVLPVCREGNPNTAQGGPIRDNFQFLYSNIQGNAEMHLAHPRAGRIFSLTIELFVDTWKSPPGTRTRQNFYSFVDHI